MRHRGSIQVAIVATVVALAGMPSGGGWGQGRVTASASTVRPEAVGPPGSPGARDGDILGPTRPEPRPGRHPPAVGTTVRLGVQPRAGPLTALMTALLAWIASRSSYAVPDSLPDVVAMTPADFEQFLCEQLARCTAPMPHAGMLAFFEFETRTIFILDTFDPHDVEHQSRMVRELVHFLQDAAGRRPGCRGVLAQEARQIANRWRAARGLPALSLTPFEMLLQWCVPGWT